MAQAKKSTKMERNKCGHLTARSRGWASPRAYYKKDGPGILARPCGQGEPGVAADVSKSLGGGRSTACFVKALNGCWSVHLAGILLLLMMTLKRLIKRGHTGVE